MGGEREILKNWVNVQRVFIQTRCVLIALLVRDRSPGMGLVQILLVGKHKTGGMSSKSFWVFQGNQKVKDDQHRRHINS